MKAIDNKTTSKLIQLHPIKRSQLHLCKYCTTKRDHDIMKINLLVFHLPSFFVYKFKEMLLDVEMTDVLIKFYSIEESKVLLNKMNERYHQYVAIYPNYIALKPIDQVIRNNIYAKQQLINMNYEAELLNTLHLSFDSVLSFEDSFTDRTGRERKSSMNSHSFSKAKVTERSLHSKDVKAMTFQDRNSSIDDIIDFANLLEYYEDNNMRRGNSYYLSLFGRRSKNDNMSFIRSTLKKMTRIELKKIVIKKDKEEGNSNDNGIDSNNKDESIKQNDVSGIEKERIEQNTRLQQIIKDKKGFKQFLSLKTLNLKKGRFASNDYFIENQKNRMKNEIDFDSKKKLIRNEAFKGFVPNKNVKANAANQSNDVNKKNNEINLPKSCSLPKLPNKIQKKIIMKSNKFNKSQSNDSLRKCFYAKCILLAYPSESYKDMGNKNNNLNNKRFIANSMFTKAIKAPKELIKFTNVSIENNNTSLMIHPNKK